MDTQRTSYGAAAERYRADSGARPAQQPYEDTNPQASYQAPPYYRPPQQAPGDYPPQQQPYPSEPYQAQQPYPAQRQPYAMQPPYASRAQQQPYPAQRSYLSPQPSGPFSLLSPGTQSVSPKPAGSLTQQ